MDLANRGPYQRHVKHTKQYGKQKGDLSKAANWKHGYHPRTRVAMALKAKHLSKDDLTSSYSPEPGKGDALDKSIPPHLTKHKVRTQRSGRRVEKYGTPKGRPAEPSTQALRKRRNALRAKVKNGSATEAERQELNKVVAKLKNRG